MEQKEAAEKRSDARKKIDGRADGWGNKLRVRADKDLE